VAVGVSDDRDKSRPVPSHDGGGHARKFVYIAAMTTLYAQGQLQLGQYAVVGPDFVLGMLFVAAFLKTPPAVSEPAQH
jgi:hypothetical protein